MPTRVVTCMPPGGSTDAADALRMGRLVKTIYRKSRFGEVEKAQPSDAGGVPTCRGGGWILPRGAGGADGGARAGRGGARGRAHRRGCGARRPSIMGDQKTHDIYINY